MSQFPHGLMFHRFHHRGGASAGQGSLTPDEFEAILHYVGIANILSPGEWLYKLERDGLGADDLCLTFDDGLKCQYEVALPVLEKHALQAFWFVYSSVFKGDPGKSEIYNKFSVNYFNEMDEFYALFFDKCRTEILQQLNTSEFKRYAAEISASSPFYSMNDLKYRYIRNELLSKENYESIVDNIIKDKGTGLGDPVKNLWLSDKQLKILTAKGHSIGLHSYDHPFRLSSLSYEEQLNQYTMNREHIESVTESKALAMSHPLNSYNQDTFDILNGLGIVCGFRANMTPPKGKKINPSRLEIARRDSSDITGAAIMVDGGWMVK